MKKSKGVYNAPKIRRIKSEKEKKPEVREKVLLQILNYF